MGKLKSFHAARLLGEVFDLVVEMEEMIHKTSLDLKSMDRSGTGQSLVVGLAIKNEELSFLIRAKGPYALTSKDFSVLETVGDVMYDLVGVFQRIPEITLPEIERVMEVYELQFHEVKTKIMNL